jgi:hypothetical protein
MPDLVLYDDTNRAMVLLDDTDSSGAAVADWDWEYGRRPRLAIEPDPTSREPYTLTPGQHRILRRSLKVHMDGQFCDAGVTDRTIQLLLTHGYLVKDHIIRGERARAVARDKIDALVQRAQLLLPTQWQDARVALNQADTLAKELGRQWFWLTEKARAALRATGASTPHAPRALTPGR